MPRAEIATRVEEALASTRMAGYGARPIDELSGGEQQRVALARALVIRPRCLLLDEPLSNLDAKLRQSMREEIRRLCKSAGLTTIYVTHDQKEALAIADRIAVMQAGRILQIGTPTEIYRRPRSRAVATFIGETNLFEGRVAGRRRRRHPRWTSPIGRSGRGARPDVRARRRRARSGSRSAPRVLRARRRADVAQRPARDASRPDDDGSLYLGEIAERQLRVGDVSLTRYELNPAAAAPRRRPRSPSRSRPRTSCCCPWTRAAE